MAFEHLDSLIAQQVAQPAQTSTTGQETAKAVPRVIGGLAQDLGEAGQYLSGDRVGRGLRAWGENLQAQNAMTPGFTAEHPIIAEAGSAAEGVAKMVPFLALDALAPEVAVPAEAGMAARGLAALRSAPMGLGVLPAQMAASQGQRSYESGIQNGLSSDEALKASYAPAATTGAGMAAMGPAVKATRGLLPAAMDVSAARAVGKGLMASVLPDLAAGTAAGTAVMQAQGAATAQAEKLSGARPDANPWKEVLANPKAWTSAALTGGMFEALSLPGKLTQGQAIREALVHPDVPKETKAQIILGTAEEIGKIDPTQAATYRATELAKLHAGEPLDTETPAAVLAPVEPEKAPSLETQQADVLEAAFGGLSADQSPLDVLREKGEQEAAQGVEDKLAPHAEAAVEAAKSPAEQKAEQALRQGSLIVKRGETVDDAVHEALAAQGKMLVDRGPEKSGSIARHRYDVVDIPEEGATNDSNQEQGHEGLEAPAGEGRPVEAEELGGQPAGDAQAPGGRQEDVVRSEQGQAIEPIRDREQRRAYDDNPNIVVARKDGKIALIDQRGKGELLGLAKIKKDGTLGGWDKAPATPQERVEAERVLRQHLGQEARFSRADRTETVLKAKRWGLPATGPTAEIADRVRIIEADPKTWTRGDLDKIAPYLSVHQDTRPESTGRVASIKEKGLSGGMVDNLRYLKEGRMSWTDGLAGGDVYLFPAGKVEYQNSFSPYLKPGNKPLIHFTAKQGQDIYEAIHQTGERWAEDGAKLNRTPSKDEIAEAKTEVVRRLADDKGLETEARRQGILTLDLKTRLAEQLKQYNEVLAGKAEYNDFQAPLEKSAIEAHLKPIIDKLKVPVEVVNSAADVPNLDTDVKFNGAFHEGKIYLNAEHLDTLSEAEHVLLKHELSHAGLRGVLGKEGLDALLTKAWGDVQSGVREFAVGKGIDVTSKAGKLEATEEYIVHLAEHGAESSLWTKFVTTFKEGLRKLGFDLKFTDAELRRLVVEARDSMKSGEGATRFSRAWHGTTAEKVPLIDASGELRPYGHPQVDKQSGGLTTEKGLVWVTPDKAIAKGFAKGVEASSDTTPGAIYGVELPKLNTIDRRTPLTQSQVDILNTMVPEYKALEPGDSLSTFEWRVYSKYGLADALKALGKDAVTMNDGKQIGVLAESIPVDEKEDVRFSRTVGQMHSADPAENKKGLKAFAEHVFPTKRALENLANATMRQIMPVDRTIKALVSRADMALLKGEFEQHNRLTKERAAKSKEYVGDVNTHKNDYMGYVKDEATARLMSKAFRMSIFETTADKPLSEQYTEKSWADSGKAQQTGLTLGEAIQEVKPFYDKLHADPKLLELHRRTVKFHKDAYEALKETAETPLYEANGKELAGQAKALLPEYLKARSDGPEILDAFAEKHGDELLPVVESFAAIHDQYPKLRGDYMPLVRIPGRYEVRAYDKDPGTGDRGRLAFMKYTDSETTARQLHTEHTAAGRISTIDTPLPHDRGKVDMPPDVVAKVLAAGKERMGPEQFEDFSDRVGKLWASALSSHSIKNDLMRRQGIAGYEENPMVAFATYMDRAHSAIADMQYNSKIAQNFLEMKNKVDAQWDDPKANQTQLMDMNNAIANLYKSHMIQAKQPVSKVAQSISKFTALWFLGSPRMYAVMWAHPFVKTLPKMAGRYGTAAYPEYLKAAKEFMGGKYSDEKIAEFTRANSRELNGREMSLPEYAVNRLKAAREGDTEAVKELNGIYQGLSASDQRLFALKTLALQGSEDVAVSHTIHDLIAGATKAEQLQNAITEKGLFLLHHADTGSRRAAATSAFAMEMKSTGDFLKANDYAWHVIDDTLADFSKENRPPILSSNVGRVLGQFQMFRLHTVGKVVQLMRDAWGTEYQKAMEAATTPEAKAAAQQGLRESRKELAYMMGTTFSMAGAAGTPLAMLVGNSLTEAVWDAMSFLFGDKDNPWDPKRDFEEGMKHAVGEDASKLFFKGIPGLFNIDASRMGGIGSMAHVIEGEVPPGLHGTQKAYWYANRILGPSWGIVANGMKAVDDVQNGDMGAAMQHTSPKIIADMMRAYGIAENGVLAPNGRTLMKPEDVNPASVALMMVGINPMEVTLAQEEAREISNLSTVLTQRRGNLVKSFEKAQASGDYDAREEALGAIDKWGRANPKLAISQRELATAVKHGLEKQVGKISKKEEIVKSMITGEGP